MTNITSFSRALKAFGNEVGIARAAGVTKQAVNVAKFRGHFSQKLAAKLALKSGKRLSAFTGGWKVDKRNGLIRPATRYGR
jgi:hypothetical protein